MPLFKKAINFKPDHLDNMTYNDCDELLLCFRYLLSREGHPIEKQTIEMNIKLLEAKMDDIKLNNFGRVKH
ncbi:hypothetical protein [Adhaeribacter aquaticus]|uniref:hypothetical protein n=1 Tax=Adhaeribacter aquaticus TaxID=299567 RepID=UPI00041CFAF5|nr:hypothetical protein [Adhaeribacter aquaticus]